MNIASPSSSGGDGHGAAHLVVPDAGRRSAAAGVPEFLAPSAAAESNKRRRRPAGTPDPDAEVVALSPKTLMESDRYVCEICNQGFQRDQNLQMHRRRHKVPWKLLKRPNLATTKRVYICPERSCLHHDRAHALGDLVGIKKHYRRKHCTEKQWKCDKCSKGYAVQSDYKAHLKTCGTRGHCCDCGRVFSRVESFIEHQDTCSAVKRKTKQFGGECERIPLHFATDTRTSNESPSQSSDTTQAMSFTQSGVSDTAARPVDTNFTKILQDEHARRIQAESQAATPSSAMPAWLTDSRGNELELLKQLPTDHAHSSDHIIIQAEVRPPRVDHPASAHGSRSQIACCSSISAAYTGSEVISCPEMKMIVEPSLQLTIGPACAEVASSSASLYPDIKPSFSNSTVLEREALILTNYHVPKQIARDENRSRSPRVGLDVLAHLVPPDSAGQSGINRRVEGAGADQAVSLSGFLTALSRVESSAGNLVHQSTKSKHENKSRTEMVSYFHPTCAGSASSYHENRAGNVPESDPALGARATRRGFSNAQLEPATSSVITSRQALHLDGAETDHHFWATSVSNELAFRSQKRMAAAAHATTIDQGRDQKRPLDMNAAWSDLTRLRRTTDEAYQECDEVQIRELARADQMLKREAREQLQFEAAEKVYAERAGEAAKRQVEISEAELVKAKRLRAHTLAELQKAGSQGFSTTFCHSCKSPIESSSPSRWSTSSSPTSWSMMVPSPSTDQLEATTRRISDAGQIFMNPGNRMSSWSESTSGFDNSGRLWPGHGYNMRNGMAIGKSPPSGRNPDLESVQMSSPKQSDRREQIAPQDFDLN